MTTERSDRDISAMMDDPSWIEEAFAKATDRAIRTHRMLGIPLAIWRDGQVALVSADELLAAREQKTEAER